MLDAKGQSIMVGHNGGVELTRQGVQDIANLTPYGRREAATTSLQSLGSSGADLKKEVATTASQTLGINDVGAKTEVATTALQALGSNAVDAKKDIATTAVQTLGANAVDAKKETATTVLQSLSHEERQEVIGQVQGPSQVVSDRIWQWVVGAFAIVFIGGSGTLVASVFFLEVAQIQVYLRCLRRLPGSLRVSSPAEQVPPVALDLLVERLHRALVVPR